MERERLNKFLAECGICSRREADNLISAGRVMVSGQPARLGAVVEEGQEVLVDGKPVARRDRKVVLLYHKPVGVVCTERDPHEKRTLSNEIKYPLRVTYAGRLDKESQGLLILTNDGALIDEMMRGAKGHEKEYIVKVDRKITEEFLKRMAGGIYLRDLKVKTRPCRTEKLGENTFRIVLTQGLNRQIRRMCGELNYRIVSLKRVRVVNLRLGDLKPGELREASEEEVRELWKCLKNSGNEGGSHGPIGKNCPDPGTGANLK